MPISSFKAGLALILLASSYPAFAKKKVAPSFPPTRAEPVSVQPTNGAIFRGAYTPLTSGARASQPGDILTILLVERMMASKSNSATTARNGGIGLTPPTTGPFNFIKPSDVTMSGDQSFKGKGDAAQSNSLSGELSVTVAEAYPNGTVLVRGEKTLMLSRGEERVQLSGIIRLVDISPDNRVASTRVADAQIHYTGKGEIARASRQGWLQRFFSKISPF
jgi:flagellar L-ring protein FlgH